MLPLGPDPLLQPPGGLLPPPPPAAPTDDEIRATPANYLNKFTTMEKVDETNYSAWSTWWTAVGIITMVATAAIVIFAFVTLATLAPAALPFLLFGGTVIVLLAQGFYSMANRKSALYAEKAENWAKFNVELAQIQRMPYDELGNFLKTVKVDATTQKTITIDPEQIEHLDALSLLSPGEPLKQIVIALAHEQYWEKTAVKSKIEADKCFAKANLPENKTEEKRGYRCSLIQQGYNEEQVNHFRAKINAAFYTRVVSNPFLPNPPEGSPDDACQPGSIRPLSLVERAALYEAADPVAEVYYKFKPGSGKADLTRDDVRDLSIQQLAVRIFDLRENVA